MVVRELSRLGRSLKQVLEDLDDLHDQGVEFISITDNFDTSTAQGKLLFQMIGAFNEFWANQARERAQAAVEQRREEGKPIGRPKKLNDEQLANVHEWNEKGLRYREIATLVEEIHGVEVTRQTIYRYCKD